MHVFWDRIGTVWFYLSAVGRSSPHPASADSTCCGRGARLAPRGSAAPTGLRACTRRPHVQTLPHQLRISQPIFWTGTSQPGSSTLILCTGARPCTT